MAKACDVSVWLDWPDVVEVQDEETGEWMEYLPERTCKEVKLAYLIWGCSECECDWQENEYNYCPNCGRRVIR